MARGKIQKKAKHPSTYKLHNTDLTTMQIQFLFRFPLLATLLLSLIWVIIKAALFPEPKVLSISESLIDERLRVWQLNTRQALTADSKQLLVNQLIEEQMLVQESLALGLDGTSAVRARMRELTEPLINGVPDHEAARIARSIEDQALATDSTIHGHLVNGLEQIFRQTLHVPPVSDSEIEQYHLKHAEEFTTPEKRTVQHVFFSESPSANTLNERLSLLAGVSTEEAYKLGEPFLSGYTFRSHSRDQLARQFGEKFAVSAFELGLRHWTGPIKSAYGYHLVWIDEIVPEQLRSVSSVADSIRDTLWRKSYEQSRAEKIAELASGYNLDLPPPYVVPKPFINQQETEL